MLENKYFRLQGYDRRTIRKIQLWIIGLAALGILLINFSPFEYLFHRIGFPGSNGCPILTLAGIPCPACGMGRGFLAFVTLDTDKMFYYNPLSPLFYSLLIVLPGGILILSLFGKSIKLEKNFFRLWYVLILILIFVWVMNILFGHHS